MITSRKGQWKRRLDGHVGGGGVKCKCCGRRGMGGRKNKLITRAVRRAYKMKADKDYY